MNHFTSLLVRNLLNNNHNLPEFGGVFSEVFRQQLEEAVHIALGIRTDGTKEIIDYSIAPNESKSNWKEMIESIRERGVTLVALFCTDGLNGMEEVISSVYPMARIQRCLLHVQRNIASKCRVSDRAEITEDFKAVYTAASREAAVGGL